MFLAAQGHSYFEGSHEPTPDRESARLKIHYHVMQNTLEREGLRADFSSLSRASHNKSGALLPPCALTWAMFHLAFAISLPARYIFSGRKVTICGNVMIRNVKRIMMIA